MVESICKRCGVKNADSGSGYCGVCERIVALPATLFHDTLMDREMAIVEVVDRGAGQAPWFRVAPTADRQDYYTLDMRHFESRFTCGRFARIK